MSKTQLQYLKQQNNNNRKAYVDFPLSLDEIANRWVEYETQKPKKFAFVHSQDCFKPVTLHLDGVEHLIQYNFCTDPFCRWFGLEQKKFENVKNKLSRYHLSIRVNHCLICNDAPEGHPDVWRTSTEVVSNWAVAEEIARLFTHSTPEEKIFEYKFHRDDCQHQGLTPLDSPTIFWKQGKQVGSKSQKWQCKSCRKFTSVAPDHKERFNYRQKRNDILNKFFMLLVHRSSVESICEILNISPLTYYRKLELIYQRCLQFNVKHEAEAFAKKQFKEIYLNTDSLEYFLNNIRRKSPHGQRRKKYNNLEDKRKQTHIICTGEVDSRYILRADLNYDWDFTLSELAKNTKLTKDDHVHNYARRYARFNQFTYYPQPPTQNDWQTDSEYQLQMDLLKRRMQYINGQHTALTYTTIAHLWHIQKLVNAKEWRLITDDSGSLTTAVMRVFANEIKDGYAHLFVAKVDKSLDKPEAYKRWCQSRQVLRTYASINGMDFASLEEIGLKYLTSNLKGIALCDYEKGYPKKPAEPIPIQHPLPTIDEGNMVINCRTNFDGYLPETVAGMVLRVNTNVLKSFFNKSRRRISIIERPLSTARADGRSYIFCNYNPKYAHMAMTIFRTVHNFCETWSSYERDESGRRVRVRKTPAQRLGIAKKKYELEDILYLR